MKTSWAFSLAPVKANITFNGKSQTKTGFKEFSITEKEPTIILLTMDELTTLYEFNFKSDRLNQARDKFCFGC